MSDKSNPPNPPPFTVTNCTFKDGKWICACNLPGKCQYVRKETSKHFRKKFWACKQDDERKRCGFWLLVEDEERAKEMLGIPPEEPRTPGNKGKKRDGELDTPFTLSKRQKSANKPASVRTPDSFKGLPAKFSPSNEVRDNAGKGSGVAFEEKLNNATTGIPTPDTKSFRHRELNYEETGAKQRRLSRDESPTPGSRAMETSSLGLPEAGHSDDLASVIINLLCAEGVSLKTSLEMQIRHEVGLRVDVQNVQIKRHERTVQELKKKVDELELRKSYLEDSLLHIVVEPQDENGL